MLEQPNREKLADNQDQAEQDLRFKIEDVLNHAEEVSKNTEGLADEKYIAYREAISDGVMQLIAETHKGYVPESEIPQRCADLAEGKTDSFPCGECGQQVTPAEPHNLDDCKRYKAKVAGERLYTQADIDRAVATGRLDALQKLNFDLIGLRDAENIKNLVTTHVARANGELRNVIPPHNPTQPTNKLENQ